MKLLLNFLKRLKFLLTNTKPVDNIIQIGDKMSDVKPEYKAKSEEIPVYTDTALGIFRDIHKGWFVAKIRYNPTTGQVSPNLEKVLTGDDRMLATERFKILTINEKIIS